MSPGKWSRGDSPTEERQAEEIDRLTNDSIVLSLSLIDAKTELSRVKAELERVRAGGFDETELRGLWAALARLDRSKDTTVLDYAYTERQLQEQADVALLVLACRKMLTMQGLNE